MRLLLSVSFIGVYCESPAGDATVVQEEEEEDGGGWWRMVPWGPQMTRGSAPPPVASVALHHQTTISIHDRAITTVRDSLYPQVP